MEKILLGKVIMNGIIHSLTGLHIGGSKETMEIGTLDAPVLRDTVTKEPYIPGSSLKGKMRSLLERYISSRNPGYINRNVGTQRNKVFIHVCNDKEDAQKCEVCRVFGSTGSDAGQNFPSRIKVRDAYFTPFTRKRLLDAESDYLFSEVKFENAIDRITAAANPRQIERVPPGCDFTFEIVYDVEDIKTIEKDIENIVMLMELIEDDCIGGYGSRGYGKVKFYIDYFILKKIEGYIKQEKEFVKELLVNKQSYDKEINYNELFSIEKVKEKIKEVGQFFKEG